MDLPEVAIRWLTKNASSNVELAAFSNVNRRWRKVVAEEIVQQILDVETNSDGSEDGRSTSAISNSSSSPDSDYSPMSRLLLPSMARSLKHRSLDLTEYSSHEVDTFCLAWFHPMGIQIRSVPLGEPTSSEDELTPEGESTEGFAPSGGNSLYDEGSDDDGKAKKKWNPRSRSSEKAAVSDSRRQTCSHEWRGYRYPMEVLVPFGYANDFVNVRPSRSIFQKTQSRTKLNILY